MRETEPSEVMAMLADVLDLGSGQIGAQMVQGGIVRYNPS